MDMELFWVFWVILIAISFGFFEAYAIIKKQPTLSRTVWNISKAWPPLGVAFGLLFGFLACHFFWPGEGCAPGVTLLDMLQR